jgi:hypothetical protein
MLFICYLVLNNTSLNYISQSSRLPHSPPQRLFYKALEWALGNIVAETLFPTNVRHVSKSGQKH